MRSALIKYGGNAMTDAAQRDRTLREIGALHADGWRVVVVHGGGPAIAEVLAAAGIESEFIDGHRRTDAATIRYVQMALRGQVNGDLVRALCSLGHSAVGLSGLDAGMVRAVRRHHTPERPGAVAVELGFVGDVDSVDASLPTRLLDHGYLPVIAPLALGEDGQTYNVNADMFAGHVAAALGAEVFVALTDVDGLRRDPEDPETVIRDLGLDELPALMGTSIRGGMIPKMEACSIALAGGVPRARILDGTRAGSVRAALAGESGHGTEVRR